METSFTQLNTDWNAEPNEPYPEVKIEGDKLELIFDLNYFQFSQFSEDQKGKIEFTGATRYRLGQTNDEGWYSGQCRFSKIAPKWGEFYLIEGNRRMSESPDDWFIVGESNRERNHYLFYLRDETFECVAESWKFETLEADQNGAGQPDNHPEKP